jgi:hypothetical protein
VAQRLKTQFHALALPGAPDALAAVRLRLKIGPVFGAKRILKLKNWQRAVCAVEALVARFPVRRRWAANPRDSLLEARDRVSIAPCSALVLQPIDGQAAAPHGLNRGQEFAGSVDDRTAAQP